MDRNLWTRLGVIVFVLGVCLYLLYPSYRYFSRYRALTQDEIAKLPEAERRDFQKVFPKSMKLGLDLQGGMHMVLELDESKGKIQNKRDAQDRVMEILSTRVDKYGVTEPSLARQGDSRIVIQLPGVEDPKSVENVMGKVAQLEFRLVDPTAQHRATLEVVQRIDEVVRQAEEAAKTDTTAAGVPRASAGAPPAGAAAADTTRKAAGDSLPFLPPPPQAAASETAEKQKNPFSSLFVAFQTGALYVADDRGYRVRQINEILGRPEVHRVIPIDSEFMWCDEEGPPTADGLPTKLLYLVNKKVELTGATLEDARVSPDPNRPGGMLINFRLNRRGARQFGKVTKANVGQQLAIILDGVVKSAPNIHSAIPNGEGQITGSFTDQQARDLSIVLRAGALPVDVKIIDERTVGPTLGGDSLHKGMVASLVGLALVCLFLSFYYNLSGVMASVGLIFNIIVVLGCMAALHAALSLPGIAGLVLSVAMAVDANVLIFERIREELRKAKTVAAAIDAGYKGAFSAIFDSNLTTLLSGIVLLYFGTGPIRGYATTLSIGITSSMFTALFVTRFAYDAITKRRRLAKLSI